MNSKQDIAHFNEFPHDACMEVWNKVCRDLGAPALESDTYLANKAGIVCTSVKRDTVFVCVAIVLGEAVAAIYAHGGEHKSKLYAHPSELARLGLTQST